MEILKAGHQYYDGFFTKFFGWMLFEKDNELSTYNNMY